MNICLFFGSFPWNLQGMEKEKEVVLEKPSQNIEFIELCTKHKDGKKEYQAYAIPKEIGKLFCAMGHFEFAESDMLDVKIAARYLVEDADQEMCSALQYLLENFQVEVLEG